MKATYNGQVIAEASKEALCYIEGNWYFPPNTVNKQYLIESPTPYTCPWKGVCQYYHVAVNDQTAQDAAWSYPSPKPSAVAQVKTDFSGYVAFWRDVVVSD